MIYVNWRKMVKVMWMIVERWAVAYMYVRMCVHIE